MQAHYKVKDNLFQVKLFSKIGYYNLALLHSLSLMDITNEISTTQMILQT